MKEFYDNYKERIKEIIICVLLLVIIGFVIYKYYFKEEVVIERTNELVVETKEDIIEEPLITTFYVDIKGEIKKPGIYQVNNNTLVNDLIKLAGGLTKNATTTNINLSQKLNESMVVVISNKKDLNKEIVSNTCTCKEVDITPCITENIVVVEEPINTTNKISINTGTIEQLMTLSGIGESKAQSIIDYREEFGLFNKIEDIMNVSGIGEAAFDKIKEIITI